MKSKAVFYHAGCPVCVSAERMVAEAIDRSRFDLAVVHLGTDRGAIRTAEQSGVKSVPALVLDNQVFHINFGASLADVAKG
ncbi:MAG TPA: thioredoxin family protein [Phycisphaerales bacterium]|nr:thioredoxin family protein [Phycisphaerales bacterium]